MIGNREVTMIVNHTPSCGQTLRPAPVMNGGGSPMPYGHASAANDEGLLGHSVLCRYLVRLFVCSQFLGDKPP
jgi:hypothetical protein